MVLSNKYKYYLLLVMIPISILICWNVALSPTINLFKELKQNSEIIQQLKNPDFTIIILNKKLRELESISETHCVNTSNYTIQTFKIIFSGKFVDLLHLMDFIERELIYFRVASASFHREELRGGIEKLYLDLYIQAYINKNQQ